MTFEALVGHIASAFIERFDAARERCWIAERDGANVGCVFLVQARDEATDAPLPGVAQLRMLLVAPSARGPAIGDALVGPESSRCADPPSDARRYTRRSPSHLEGQRP